jgi:flagellar biosynthetic protein FliP
MRKSFRVGPALLFISILAVVVALLPRNAGAQEDAPFPVPRISVQVGTAETPQEVGTTLQIFFLLTILTLAPAMLVLLTCFTRIVIVLGFLRQALATQQMPPNQVLVGLALFLTFFIMAPVGRQINDNALQPYLNNEIGQRAALDSALAPVRNFMFDQTRAKEIMLFTRIARLERPQNRDDVPTHVLIPAFVINELRIAFGIGFMIYVPFLIIDMVVASVLMSMGMLMLPPIFISLPFKVILFVLADGWYLLANSLVTSFRLPVY